MALDKIAFSPLTREQYAHLELSSDQQAEKAQLIAELWSAMSCPTHATLRLYERDISGKAVVRVFSSDKSSQILSVTGEQQDLLNKILEIPGPHAPVTVSSPAAAASLAATTAPASSKSSPSTSTQATEQLSANYRKPRVNSKTQDKLKVQVTALTNSLVDLRTQYDALTKQIAGLENRELQLTKEKSAVQEEQSTLELRLKELTAQNLHLSETVSSTQRTLTLAEEENTALNNTIAQQKRTAQDRTETIKNLEQEQERLNQKNSELEKALAVKELAQATLTKQAANDAETIAALRKELAAKAAPAPVTEESNELLELREKVADQAQQLANQEIMFRQEQSNLKIQLETDGREKTRLEATVTHLMAEGLNQAREQREARATIKAQQTQILELQQKLKTIQLLETERDLLASTQYLHLQTIEQLGKEKKLLAAQTQEAAKDREIYQARILQLEAELDAIRKRLEQTEMQLQLSQKALKESEATATYDSEVYEDKIKRTKQSKGSPRHEALQALEIENDRLRHTPSPTQTSAASAAAAQSEPEAGADRSEEMTPELERAMAQVALAAAQGLEKFGSPEKPGNNED
ncbi:MAG TPA: hypothetical protein VGM34_00310 [Chlamydiales bacterium]|jgi:hypothetical protein